MLKSLGTELTAAILPLPLHEPAFGAVAIRRLFFHVTLTPNRPTVSFVILQKKRERKRRRGEERGGETGKCLP